MVHEPTQAEIQTLFDTITPEYDRFNRLSSAGQDMRWRQQAVSLLKPGMRVLDVGTGSGDLAFEAMRAMGGYGEVVGVDFSKPMLDLAEEKRRALAMPGSMRWEYRKAEDIPFEDEPYDAVISGFVLRNLYHHIEPILKGIYASLKPGGIISFLDLTEQDNVVLRLGSHIYLNTVVRLWSWVCFRNAQSARYLSGSMKRFFKAKEFIQLLESVGFENIQTQSFLLGSVTHYKANKPQ